MSGSAWCQRTLNFCASIEPRGTPIRPAIIAMTPNLYATLEQTQITRELGMYDEHLRVHISSFMRLETHSSVVTIFSIVLQCKAVGNERGSPECQCTRDERDAGESGRGEHEASTARNVGRVRFFFMKTYCGTIVKSFQSI